MDSITKKPFPRALLVLDILAAVSLAVALWMALVYAPRELVMGDVQRVFYFHVASAWTGMLGYLLAVITSIAFLRTGKMNLDVASLAGIEIGLVFTALCVISGSIWARPIWNTWWTWDPRLTTAFIMELIYAAYLLLRRGVEDPAQRARLSAVYAIIGFITVPLTFLSIRIFRTIHPVIFGGEASVGSSNFVMSSQMLQAFLFSLFAFTLLFAAFYWHRLRLGLRQQQIEAIELQRRQDEEEE
jgi:heme exporter protein C